VLIGGSFENFREIVTMLQAQDGIRVVTVGAFAATLVDILRHKDEARAMGGRGHEVFEAQAGATARTVEALMTLPRESGR
jgi:3-deoxy-D-manno-octulosonic-acid transferase